MSVEEDRIDMLALGREGYTAAVRLLDSEHCAVAKEDLLGRCTLGAAADKDEAMAAGERALQRLV